jgi:hypothetical protein
MEQGVGEDEVVGSARRRVSGQRDLVEADPVSEVRTFCLLAPQREHRGRAVHGVDGPPRKGPGEPKRNVAGTAPQIQGDAIGRKIDQALFQEIDEPAVWLFEVGRCVDSGLTLAEHQLRLCDAIHLRYLTARRIDADRLGKGPTGDVESRRVDTGDYQKWFSVTRADSPSHVLRYYDSAKAGAGEPRGLGKWPG